MNVGINSSGNRFRDWAEMVIGCMGPDSAISYDAVELEPISYKPSEKWQLHLSSEVIEFIKKECQNEIPSTSRFRNCSKSFTPFA
jgi:hypothetical protein